VLDSVHNSCHALNSVLAVLDAVGLCWFAVQTKLVKVDLRRCQWLPVQWQAEYFSTNRQAGQALTQDCSLRHGPSFSTGAAD
jgi:hypothetical protein